MNTPDSLMSKLVKDQIEESLMTPKPSGNVFFDDSLLLSEAMNAQPIELSTELAQCQDPEALKVLGQYLRGRLFQNAAFWIYSSQNAPNATLLSPQRTLDLFQCMYPESESLSYPLGFDTLKGISVPDGVMVENGRITEHWEYSIHGRIGNLINRLDALRKTKNQFPNLYDPKPIGHFILAKGANIFDRGIDKNRTFKRVGFMMEEFIGKGTLRALSEKLLKSTA